MPPSGAEARAEQRATLNRIAHELQVSPDLGELLEELRPFEEEHDYDSFEASLIRVARRDYEKAVRVPPELRAELTRAGSLGYQGWLRAREQEDYGDHAAAPRAEPRAAPPVRRLLRARRRPVRHRARRLRARHEDASRSRRSSTAQGGAPADDPGGRRDAEPIDDSCLRGRFPRDAQRRFALAVLERWGMDRAAWRLDKTVHPFATSFAPTDIRLTTNFHEDSLHGILSCLHEFGHGIYERQVDPAYTRTPLAQGVSSAFHESQSRMWENLVGRSISTWRFFYPKLQEEFPEQFGDVSLETLPPRAEQGAAVVPARRRRRGDVLPAHHPPLRARARDALRRARARGPAGGVRREDARVPRAPAARRRRRRPPGRPLVGHEHGLLPDLRARERRLGAALGARRGRPRRPRRAVRARRVRRRCASGCARTSTGTAARSRRRSSCSA